MKLTTDEHAKIARHPHAADNHLSTVLDIVCNRNGTANVPIEIVEGIEKARAALGATPGASRDNAGSVLSRCESVLLSDWPSSTLDTYHGSYGQCVTLALEEPYRPPSEG